jgi:hypothetical protein
MLLFRTTTLNGRIVYFVFEMNYTHSKTIKKIHKQTTTTTTIKINQTPSSSIPEDPVLFELLITMEEEPGTMGCFSFASRSITSFLSVV